jgi:DNA repair photolyase
MGVREIQAKSILRKQKKIDSWFISHYGMNLYRGCTHDCAYCDGRAEGYYVEGEFGRDVAVKVNALEILNRELDPKRKRKSLKKGYFMVGGGVGDSYQPLEQKYRLTRNTLVLLEKYGFPVHILTKSTRVKRDMDILQRINHKSRVIISLSFSSMDDEISSVVEPGVPSPAERLALLSGFKHKGFTCGLFLLPALPGLTDTPEQIDRVFRQAMECGLDFIIGGGLTLKEGRQKEYFLDVINTHFPELVSGYKRLYPGHAWGQAPPEYCRSLNQKILNASLKYQLPVRIPADFFRDLLSEEDLVIVILEHIDYLLKLRGKVSSHGYVAYFISKFPGSLSDPKTKPGMIPGIPKSSQAMIAEILETGTCGLYEDLIRGS